MRKLSIVVSTTFVALVAASVMAGKVDTWRQSSAADFQKGKTQNAVISSQGYIRLSRELKPWSDLNVSFVWDLAQGKDGSVYAATGEEGKIFKIDAEGKSSLLYDSEELHVLSLATAPDGTLYAGTAPNGLVLKVTSDGKATTHFKTGKNYVWQLAVDPEGVLYAGTGTKAEIFRITPDGQGASLYAANQNHVLALALGKDGMIYAGCDGEGLVYRITPKGKAFVLYDANQEEVRTILAGEDGALYVGTSTPAPMIPRTFPSSPMPTAPPTSSTSGGTGSSFDSKASKPTENATDKTQPPATPAQSSSTSSASTRAATDGSSPAQGATPKVTPGVNAIYRIAPDGGVRELFQERVLIFSLAKRNDRLLVGTGQAGQLFELDDREREKSEVAKLDHGEILCMTQRPDGSIVLGTGDPGKLYLLTAGAYAAKGTFESQVFDAGMISKWGAIRWQADAPDGTKVSFSLRSGNVKTPDDTWTDWSTELLDSQTAQVPCPNSRFLQFRTTLESARADVTPTLRGVQVRYMTVNQAPEVTKLEVPDIGEGDGSSRTTKLKVKWESKDPNNDEMEYTLQYRKDGWKDWIKIAEKQTKKEYDWDTESVPDGVYRVRIDVSDRGDNPAESALTGSRESTAFVVDHTPPVVKVKVAESKPGEVAFEVEAADQLTRLVGCSYSVDSSSWSKTFPVDQLFDSKSESFRFTPSDLKAGSHLIMVRVVDAAGNTGAADLVFSVEEK